MAPSDMPDCHVPVVMAPRSRVDALSAATVRTPHGACVYGPCGDALFRCVTCGRIARALSEFCETHYQIATQPDRNGGES